MYNWFEAEIIARERGRSINEPLTDSERVRLEIIAEESRARGSLRERIAAKFAGIRFGADPFDEEIDPKDDILMEARLSGYLR